MEKILNPIKRQLKALDVLYSLQRKNTRYYWEIAKVNYLKTSLPFRD